MFYNLLLSAAAVFVSLAVFEIATRVFFDPVSRANTTPVPSSVRMKSQLPDLPYTLRPNSTGTQSFGTNPEGYFDEGATLTYRVNSLGFRGAETTVEKPANTIRIIGLGDSFTFGTGVRNADTFLSVMETDLSESLGTGNIEVLNLGVSGYNTDHELRLLLHLGLKLQPDIVVLCFFLNDTDSTSSMGAFRNHLGRSQLPLWRRYSRLGDILASKLERHRAGRELVSDYNDSYREDAEGWKHSRKALNRFQELSVQHGFKAVLVVFPVLWSLSDDYPSLGIHRTISGFASSIDLPVLDLLPEFGGFDGPELWAHPNNQHPNPEAHRIAGNALAKFLSNTYPSIFPGSRQEVFSAQETQ